MPKINNYDPNPYDNVTIDEALAQIYDRVNDRTIRQIVTLLKKAIDNGGNTPVNVVVSAKSAGLPIIGNLSVIEEG